MEESISMVETRITQVEDRLAQFKKQEAARKVAEKYEEPMIVGNSLWLLNQIELTQKIREEAIKQMSLKGQINSLKLRYEELSRI